MDFRTAERHASRHSALNTHDSIDSLDTSTEHIQHAARRAEQSHCSVTSLGIQLRRDTTEHIIRRRYHAGLRERFPATRATTPSESCLADINERLVDSSACFHS
jgi:hypothetical protein